VTKTRSRSWRCPACNRLNSSMVSHCCICDTQRDDLAAASTLHMVEDPPPVGVAGGGGNVPDLSTLEDYYPCCGAATYGGHLENTARKLCSHKALIKALSRRRR
jgi:hypothetical protein